MKLKPADAEPRLLDIFYMHTGVDKSAICRNSKIVDDLEMDSLDKIDIIMDIEKAFDCSIPDEVSDKFETFGDVVEYFEEALANQ